MTRKQINPKPTGVIGLLIITIFIFSSATASAQNGMDIPSPPNTVSANVMTFEKQGIDFPNPFNTDSLFGGINSMRNRIEPHNNNAIQDSISQDLMVNLFMDIGYTQKESIDMTAVKLKTEWKGTLMNTTYYCEDNQLELGISTETINKWLPEKMTMQLKANPQSGMTAIEFKIGL